jgi:hypothetical protein
MKLIAFLIIPVILVVSCVGCNTTSSTAQLVTTPITYKTYEMKPDDSRLKNFQHPLFSFEYPEAFTLVDLNKIPEYLGDYHRSDIDFLIKRPNLPSIKIEIIITESGVKGYQDAKLMFNSWISEARSDGDTIESGRKTVSHIKSYYFARWGYREDYIIAGHLVYPASNRSFRAVVFDYHQLTWSISLTWDYFDSEPPEAQEYFNHIIETFKILE